MAKIKKMRPKLTEFDKATYVLDEIFMQSKKYGEFIPTKIIVKEFSREEFFKIPEKEVIKIISKLENNGIINISRKGCIGISS